MPFQLRTAEAPGSTDTALLTKITRGAAPTSGGGCTGGVRQLLSGGCTAEQEPLHSNVPLLVCPQLLAADVQGVLYVAGLAGERHTTGAPTATVTLLGILVPLAFEQVSVYVYVLMLVRTPCETLVPMTGLAPDQSPEAVQDVGLLRALHVN